MYNILWLTCKVIMHLLKATIYSIFRFFLQKDQLVHIISVAVTISPAVEKTLSPGTERGIAG